MEAYIASPQVPFEPPIRAQEPQAMPIVPSERWVVTDRKRLSKTFSFANISKRNTFATMLIQFDEQTEHNAEILISENDVKVKLWTRSSDSLTDLDKEYAKAVDEIYRDLTCQLPTIYMRNTVG